MNIVIVLMKQKTSFETSKNGEKIFFDEDFLNFFLIFFELNIFKCDLLLMK